MRFLAIVQPLPRRRVREGPAGIRRDDREPAEPGLPKQARRCLFPPVRTDPAASPRRAALRSIASSRAATRDAASPAVGGRGARLASREVERLTGTGSGPVGSSPKDAQGLMGRRVKCWREREKLPRALASQFSFKLLF